MQSNSDYTPQQYRKYNGQMVFKALRAIGNEVSADDLANHIAEYIGEREEAVLPEIKQILRRGIVNGFLVRNGMYYSLVGDNDNVQVDSVSPRRKRASSGYVFDSNKRRKTSNRMLARNDIEEDYSDYSDEDVDDEETDDNQTSLENNRPKVKLYEILAPEPISDEDDEEQNEYSSDSEVEAPRRPLLALKNINQK